MDTADLIYILIYVIFGLASAGFIVLASRMGDK